MSPANRPPPDTSPIRAPNTSSMASCKAGKDAGRPLPTMRLNPAVTDIFGFKYEDFQLENYEPWPAIKAPVAV